MTEIPLILGGHTFISQLGNDPPASEEAQREIVEQCLNQGMHWIDTTYQPERVALGRILAELGRREEATLLAWNFFRDFAPGQPVGEASDYTADSIGIILDQLRTTSIDALVAICRDDPDANHRQEELLKKWKTQGLVRSVGLWIPDATSVEHYRRSDLYQFAVRPYNTRKPEDAAYFATSKMPGRETFATSPFYRGWELDRMVEAGVKHCFGNAETLRPRLADLMLRFSLFESGADRVIIAIRKPEWVSRNVESIAKGALVTEERNFLERLRELRNIEDVWWRRGLRRLSGAPRRPA